VFHALTVAGVIMTGCSRMPMKRFILQSDLAAALCHSAIPVGGGTVRTLKAENTCAQFNLQMS
jgi:hypothetical protein